MRALLLILDSVGIGHAPDATAFGDDGADTLGHLIDRFPDLPANLPHLWSLGLGNILGRSPVPAPSASFGQMQEVSPGKDSTTGHWEIAGAVLRQPFGHFHSFPPELVQAIERDAGVTFLGNFPASGTQVIDDLGPEHLRTGRPILYTSADSVLQVAAHEGVIPVDRLYDICRVARRHADAYRIGRVIARPFVGSPTAGFTRTANRHDYSMRPPPTVLNAMVDAGLPVVGVGKTRDLFAGSGITESHPTRSNADGVSTTHRLWRTTRRGLLFTNLVDFDTEFGHRRDPAGYARALVDFDRWLGTFLPELRDADLFIITADHGNDPTYRGTDHTRECVPLLVRHRGRTADLGLRNTFADVAASLAAFFRLPEPWPAGKSFIAPPSRRASRAHRPPDAPNSESVPGRAKTPLPPPRVTTLPRSAPPA